MSFLITLIFSIFLIKFGESKNDLPILGVVGGIGVNIEDYRYQVALLKNGEHLCGGVIYKRGVVLTAAHCLEDVKPSDLSVRAGSYDYQTGGRRIDVQDFEIHPYYDYDEYDVAVLYLKKNFKFGSTIDSIEIADKEPAVGSQVTASGWGVTNLEINKSVRYLNAVNVTVINREECAKKYVKELVITENLICAGVELGGKDACGGDSGGPLVQDKKLVGITSFGRKCGDPNYPGVYTNAVKLQKWIDELADLTV